MNNPAEKKKRVNVYVVQGDSRDHHGDILMVTRDYNKATTRCKRLIYLWNAKDEAVGKVVRHDYAKMKTVDFINKYSGNSWVAAPVLTWYFV